MKDKFKNYKGISLLSILGKLYGKVVINKVRELTNGAMEKEQGGFREGSGCADVQIKSLHVRCLSKMYLEKHKDAYVAFMDLKKTYDRVDKKTLWQLLSVCMEWEVIFKQQ